MSDAQKKAPQTEGEQHGIVATEGVRYDNIIPQQTPVRQWVTPKLHHKPLRYFLDRGIPVVPTYDSGATVGKWSDPASFTTDPAVVAEHWENGIRRYQFAPDAAGFIVLDLDVKNGRNGVEALWGLYSAAGAPLPDLLHRIEVFPAMTTTPSGGAHLYFQDTGRGPYRSGEIAPGLEVVHSRHLLTAPGSVKNDRQYLFFGDLDAAPAFPLLLRQYLRPVNTTSAPRRTTWAHEQRSDADRPTLDRIRDWKESDGNYSGRNDLCNQIAYKAATYGYSAAEVEQYLREQFEAPDHTAREIAATVASAFRGVA